MLSKAKERSTSKSNWRIVLVLGATGILLIFSPVMAAPLTYSTATTISLTSSGVNFTVASGSVADSLTINPANIVVVLSTSTGGTFTLTSPSANLSVAQVGSGGSAPVSCIGPAGTNGTASVTLTQSSASTSYTISPASPQCSVPAGAVVSTPASGGGGGGGGYYAPSSTPASVSTSTSANATTTQSLQNQLNTLMATLQALIAQANQQGIPLPPGVQSSFKSNPQLIRNLYIGSKGDDVKSLQLFLIAKNSGPFAQKLATIGATGIFGPLTRKTLGEFQKSVGIKPANGYFGPKTRAYIHLQDQ